MSAPQPFPDRSRELAGLVGQPTGPLAVAPDPVNQPMIRHWVEAMGDRNPVYVSQQAAREAGFDGVIAPPTMLQAWVMRGLEATLASEEARQGPPPDRAGAHEVMMALFDEEGMTSVVATDCEQEYHRPLRLGERLAARSTIEEISPVKQTALGAGRFATTLSEFLAVPDHPVGTASLEELARQGEPVATMRFRILKYRPRLCSPEGTAQGASPEAGPGSPVPGDQPHPPTPGERPRRPRPAITQDNAFFFEGTRAGQILIQRCTGCGTLRHPPLPACARCRSTAWDTVVASGRGTLFSYVVVHHPQVPAFDYPLAIGLVELDEGTRLVADLAAPEGFAWQIGTAVQASMETFDEELTLPVFHPLGGPGDGAVEGT